jgi:hypothetical protein
VSKMYSSNTLAWQESIFPVFCVGIL